MKLFISEEKFKPYCYLSFLPTSEKDVEIKLTKEEYDEYNDSFSKFSRWQIKFMEEIIKVCDFNDPEEAANRKDENVQGLLVNFILLERPHMIDELIKKGADINIRDNSSMTPLMHACHVGNKEIVVKLINAGANLDLQDKYGQTAIMYAAAKSHIEIMVLLLKKGIDITIEDIKGRSILKMIQECLQEDGDNFV